MDEPHFWEIVQQAHDHADGDMDRKCEILMSAITKLSKDDARAFLGIFHATMDHAYSWPLWGAAYIINGGCGDDTFSDFRASLISRGRIAFERAIADPESLATEDFDEDSWFYESYQYAVTDAVKAVAGSIQPRDPPYPNESSGEKWSEDQVYGLYPRLSEKFA